MFRQKERKEQQMYMYMLCSSPAIHTLLYISNQKRGEIPCQVQIKYTHIHIQIHVHISTRTLKKFQAKCWENVIVLKSTTEISRKRKHGQ